MKAVCGVLLAALLFSAAFAAEEQKEKEEKKPVEKVVWPSIYSPLVYSGVKPVVWHQPLVVPVPAHVQWW